MLRYRADIRTLAFEAIYFALLVGQWIYAPTNLWLAVPLFAATCVFAFFGAVATHNTVHCPVFKQRWVNRLFQIVLTLTYGHPVSSYVPGHNLSHHKHTETQRDVMRTSKARFRYNLFNVLFFFFVIGKDISKGEFQYIGEMRTRNPKWVRQLLIEFAVLMVVQVALFVIDWRKALVYWLIPHVYAQWGIVTMNLLQHDGCDATHPYNHSRNFTSKLLNFFVYNNGYHGIHHSHSGLHWSLTPEAHGREYHPHIHPNLEQPSIAAYCWRTFVMNQRLNYDGTPRVLEPKGEDERWVPRPEETPEDLGAEAYAWPRTAPGN
ncbi:MAG: fatty acid desaturase [Polyangiales bacterium]|nr:fatty acid desaturase [Myxococcales bacterium]